MAKIGAAVAPDFDEGWAVRPPVRPHYYRRPGNAVFLTSLCGRSTQSAAVLLNPGDLPRCAICARLAPPDPDVR